MPGQPVVLVFEGRQVYHSGNLNGNVQENFKVDLPPITAQSTSELNIQLKIGTKVMHHRRDAAVCEAVANNTTWLFAAWCARECMCVRAYIQNFDNTLKVDVKDGRNLKLVFTDKGLSIQQRSQAF